MKRIGVMANLNKPSVADVLRRLASRARALHMEVVVCDEETARLLPGSERCSLAELPGRIDVLAALGGDGTLLHAVRQLQGADTPVLGVNLGSLGFMTSVPLENLETALDTLAAGSYTLSVRALAACRLSRDGEVAAEYHALNDVVIGWGAASRVITLELRLDNEDVSSYVCDGLIVSTPTGSTGHSLSAGGPILHPMAPVFVVSLICPHTLSHRPLVVPDGSVLRVRVAAANKELLLAVDGQEQKPVEEGDVLEVWRSPYNVRLVHLPGYSYFAVLRQKLHWRGSSV